MASASLLSSSPLKTPISADNSSRIHANFNGAWAAEGRNRRRRARRGMVVVSNSSDGEVEKMEKPAFNPFGFVTDNPSSRSAIQLPESPAEDGNVGQMLYRIEDKKKEYGSYVKSGKLRWFVRETVGIITVLLAWGVSDKYLRLSEAEEFQKGNPDIITLKPIEEAGHMPQGRPGQRRLLKLCDIFFSKLS